MVIEDDGKLYIFSNLIRKDFQDMNINIINVIATGELIRSNAMRSRLMMKLTEK